MIGSRVVHERLIARYVERNMTATVAILRKDEFPMGVDNIVATDQTPIPVYRGMARVYLVQGPVTYQLGEEPQYFSSTYVTVPIDHKADEAGYWVTGDPVRPQVDDLVEVETHPDAYMVGRKFRVTDVEAGGLVRPFIRLQAAGVQRFKGWSPNNPQAGEFDIPEEWRV